MRATHQRLTRLFFLWLFFMACHQVGKATHITGGSLTYNHLGNSMYRIRLELIRDCSGILSSPFLHADSIRIFMRNGCTNALATEKWLQRVGMDTLSLRCFNNNTLTTCTGGIFPGEILYRWEGNVQLPTPTQASGCNNQWYFSWGANANNGLCCLINSSTFSPAPSYFIDAYLNNNVPNGNSSVSYTAATIPLYCTGTPIRMRFNSITNDNDSLSFALTNHLTAWQTPATYATGLNAQLPLLVTAGSFQIDHATAIISFSTSNPQRGFINMQTNEFREGTLVGYTKRNNIITLVPGNCAIMDTITLSGCDSVVAPSGQVFYNSTSYLDTLYGLERCDTIRVYEIVVTQPVTGSRIAGTKHVLPGSRHVYRAEQFGNASDFNWQIEGGTFSTHGSDEIIVDWGTLGLGKITVNCIDGNGCERTLSDTVQINNSVSVAEHPGSFTLIYPQPAAQFIIIKALFDMQQIELHDLSGRLIQSFETSESSSSIDLSTIAAGSYFLRIRYKEGSWSTHHILLQR